MSTNYLTISEVTQQTGEHQETLKKRCQKGLIPGAILKGKTWLIPDKYVLGISRQRAGLYIDGANILHGGLDVGWLISYDKLVPFIKKNYLPVVMSHYDSVGFEKLPDGTIQKDESGTPVSSKKQEKFYNYLRGIGFRVVTKPLKYIDGDIKLPKNNMDSYLTLDVVKEMGQWDTLLLFSGDCDFDRLVEELISAGKSVHIFSYANRLSYELRVKAFTSPLVRFTELDKLKNLLAKDKKV